MAWWRREPSPARRRLLRVRESSCRLPRAVCGAVQLVHAVRYSQSPELCKRQASTPRRCRYHGQGGVAGDGDEEEPEMYSVRYDDGDTEDMLTSELQALLPAGATGE